MGYNIEDESFHNLMWGHSKNPPAKKLPPFNPLKFEKIIYDFKNKTQEIIYNALQQEVDYIKRLNPEYELEAFSEPVKNADGSLTYYITFKSK